MNKQRIASIATTVVMLLLVLAAHIITDKHLNDTRGKYELYNDSIATLTGLVSGLGGKSVPDRLAQIRTAEPQAKRAISDIRGVLDYFEGLRVPKKLQRELDDIKAAIESEREFMDKLERVFTVQLADDFRQAATEAGEAAGLESDYESFNSALERFMERMEDCRPGMRRVFFWL